MTTRIHILLLVCALSVSELQAAPKGEGTAAPVEHRLEEFVDNIAAFNQILPQEKVYLHFDNTSYFLGETLWFKAYVVKAENHRPTPPSRILYVELVSQEGQILQTKRLKIENGQCHGEFVLDKDKYRAGYFEVRAYTRAMLNFGVIQNDFEEETWAYFFNKEYQKRFYQENSTLFSRVFPVYDEPGKPGQYSEKHMTRRPRLTGRLERQSDSGPVVTFYPEGGSLVNGITSRVAFEARTAEGEYVDIKGVVTIDGVKSSKGHFATQHRGKGVFHYLPMQGHFGKVQVDYNGKEYTYDLPGALQQGYVLEVSPAGNEDYNVLVTKSAGMPDETVGLSVVCRGKPCFFETLHLQPQGIGTLRIPGDSLPSGVSQITLFSNKGEIFAQRLVFVNHGDCQQNKLHVEQDGKDLLPYNRVQIGLHLDGNPDGAKTISVAVRDNGSLEKTLTEQTIKSNLLLCSDVRGFIECPDYYLESNRPERRRELDLLLMVQGWSRYNWKSMSGNSTFEFRYKYEQTFDLFGQAVPYMGLKSAQRKQLQKGISMQAVLIVDSVECQGIDSCDTQGNFSFRLPEFEGDAILYLRPVNTPKTINKNSNVLYFSSTPINGAVAEYEGHWYDLFIPVRNNYVPQPKKFSWYECHSGMQLLPNGRIASAEPDFNIPDTLGEAWSIQLNDMIVEATTQLKRLDFSKPAFHLDPNEELNTQLDMGIFHGGFTVHSIAEYAVFRLGLRGIGTTLTDRHGYKYGTPLFGGEEARSRDARMYMERYGTRSRLARLSGYNLIRVSDSVAREKSFVDFGNTQYIDIFTDKDYRGTQSFEDIRNSYSLNYVVNIGTYPKDYPAMPVFNGRRITYRGFSSSATFYQPDYSRRSLGDAPKDYRRTLYWNPDVPLDAQGNAQIEFYNNGSCTRLSVSAEGITPTGLPISN